MHYIGIRYAVTLAKLDGIRTSIIYRDLYRVEVSSTGRRSPTQQNQALYCRVILVAFESE